MKDKLKILLMILAVGFTLGCQQEEFELSENPVDEADATFTITQGIEGDNYFVFNNDASGFIKSWDFGNGTSAKGNEVTGYFPFEGVYEVTLTVYNAGGSVTTSQMLTIDSTDPEICNVETLQLLTGGCEAVEGKTWIIDAERKGHLGLGPAAGNWAEWYEAGANEKVGGGLYDDEYTFVLNQSVFNMETNGDVYIRGDQAGNFPGSYDAGVGDLAAPYDAREGSYALSTAGDDQYINLSAGTFIGFYTGSNSYQIMSINENEMYLRQQDLGNPALAWYQRLIRKGYAPLSAGFTSAIQGLTVTFTNTSANADEYSWDFGDGNSSTEENPVHTYTADGTYTVTLTTTSPGQEEEASVEITVADVAKELPITWEEDDIIFGGFGGTVFNVVNNPDPDDVNSSTRVGEYIKGFDGSWAGIEIVLDDPIDFSSNSTLSLKVNSPVTGRALFKLEDPGGGTTAVEVFADINSTDEWVELSFDFAAAASNTFDKIALFMDFDNNAGGTFYIDDIQFLYKPLITLDDLTGGSAKAWKLKPGADTWGIGPWPGSPEYYPGWGNDISGDRPCLWNDEWVFNVNGTMEYRTNGDLFAESAYMGAVGDGCVPDNTLVGTDAEPWGPGTHSYALSQGSVGGDGYLTLIGQGAFIGLAKAYNGGEYTTPPPNANANVTYTIYDYVNDGENEELKLTINVGGNYWSYILIPSN